jgi:hypothetical protein
LSNQPKPASGQGPAELSGEALCLRRNMEKALRDGESIQTPGGRRGAASFGAYGERIGLVPKLVWRMAAVNVTTLAPEAVAGIRARYARDVLPATAFTDCCSGLHEAAQ